MSFNPWDPNDPVRRMMKEMEDIRRMTEPFSDVFRQLRPDLDLLKGSDALGEMRRQLGNQPGMEKQQWLVTEGRSILHELEERRAILGEFEERRRILHDLEDRYQIQRHMTEAFASSSFYEEAIRGTASVSDIFSRHRGLIDAYVFDTFYGGGTSSIGGSTGSLSFQRANEELAESYEEISESADSEEGESTPPLAMAGASVEAFASAEVVEELVTPAEERAEGEEEEEADEHRETRRQIRQELHDGGRHELRPALEALDPRLVTMWEGSDLALSGTNPDRIRHFSASRRELMTHVLHRLSPDEAVHRWNDDPNLYHEGRPTRSARLRYICRSIDQEPLRKFVEINTKLVLETLDLFQKGTHALEASFTPEQLQALATRMDQHLLFLLQLGNRRN